MNYIENKDITIVVQGPIYGTSTDPYEKQYTRICCENLRKYFSGAEIILSTWENSDVSHIEYDILVENEDPGTTEMTLDGSYKLNNTNRMIISSMNGIKKVNRKYCMRIRSDMIINGNGLLKYFGFYNKKSYGQVVEERILTLSAIHPTRGKAIFSVNDWFYFGLTKDLISLYDIPLQLEKNLLKEEDELYPSWERNIVSEQHVWTSFLKKYPYYKDKIKITKMHEMDDASIKIYEESLADNLVLLPPNKLMVNSLKMPNKNYVRKNFLRMSCYTENEWKKMYKKYCDREQKIQFSIKDNFDIFLYDTMFFIRSHYPKIYNIGKKIYNKF